MDFVDDRDRLLPPGRGAQPPRLRVRRRARRDVDDRTSSLHGVELPDEVQDLLARPRIMRLGLHEFAADVGPAVGEREAGAGPGERGVGAVAVGDHNAGVAVQHLARGVLRSAVQNRVRDRILARHAPGPPPRRPAALQKAPPRLVGPEHWRRQHVLPHRFVRRRQDCRQGVELIPQRLRIDRQPLAVHPPRLALQRQMVQVLVERDLDRERGGVAMAAHIGPGREPQRAGRGVHAAVARAAVLLPLVLDDHELSLEDGNLLAVLRLPLHLLECPAALRAGPVRGIELVHPLDDRQPGLGGRAMAAAGRRRRRGLRHRGAWPLLRRGAEQRAFALRKQLFRNSSPFPVWSVTRSVVHRCAGTRRCNDGDRGSSLPLAGSPARQG